MKENCSRIPYSLSILIVSLFFAACNHKIDNINEYYNKENDNVLFDTLKCTGRVVFPLDSTTSYIFRASEYNENNDTYSFIFNNNLLIYSYNEEKLINKIKLNISSPTSYTILSEDSIIVFDYKHNSINLINCHGECYDKIDIEENIKYYPSPVCKISPLIKRNEQIIFWGNIAGEYIDENITNRKVMGIIDLSRKTTQYNVSYPEMYYKSNWGGGLFRWVYADYNCDKDFYVLSFPAVHFISIVSPNGDIIRNHYAGSRQIKKISSLSESKFEQIPSENRTSHFVENDSYANIIYDKYKKIYYRIAELGCEYSNSIGWHKNIVIITMNEHFEIIEETNIGECNSNYRYSMFVNKNGLHIPEKTSEDYLSFKVYKYEKITK